jgi:hypothetical protein
MGGEMGTNSSDFAEGYRYVAVPESSIHAVAQSVGFHKLNTSSAIIPNQKCLLPSQPYALKTSSVSPVLGALMFQDFNHG